MAQRVENSKAKQKGNFYGRGLALCSQMAGQTVNEATATNADNYYWARKNLICNWYCLVLLKLYVYLIIIDFKKSYKIINQNRLSQCMDGWSLDKTYL